MRKQTTSEFIVKANAVHGNKYDYSNVEYVSSRSVVIIECKDHGLFKQRPNGHLNGYGCNKCAGNTKSSTQEFIEKARAIHGDKYIYSRTEYITAIKKLSINCPLHGDFDQTPNNHLHGYGCKRCAIDKRANNKRTTLENFINNAHQIHGESYGYEKSSYISTHEKVTIICKLHGEFHQTPAAHLQGQGCPRCTNTVKWTTDLFVINAKLTHGDKYAYDRVVYESVNKKVLILCKQHGYFEQTPYLHINSSGCFKCSGFYPKGTDEFIKTATEVHGDKYSYDKTQYESAHKKLIITCHEHGDFSQTARKHTYGSGCPYCATHGFNKNKPATLYYLRLNLDDGSKLWKIGVTNNKLKSRYYGRDLEIIDTIFQWNFEKGSSAYAAEQAILKKFSGHKYKGDNVLSANGNTELFTKDVLGLDARFLTDSQPDAGNRAVDLFGVK